MFEQIASAAPLLVRHAGAYGELIADDVLTAWQAFGRRLLAGIVLVMAILIALLLASAWLIAFTWNTPERLEMIASLAGFFALVSVIACVVMVRLRSRPTRLLDQTRQEWDRDLLLVEELLLNTPE
jgi:hypothetical protein